MQQSEDQRELAETLHDGAMHLLTAIRLKLRAIEIEAGQLSDEARGNLRDIDVLSDRALTDLTRLVRRLAGPNPASPGRAAEPAGPPERLLLLRLQELAKAFGDDTGIDCSLSVTEDHLRFPATIGEVIYRSVGELLNNVEKHADASRVQIRTDVREDGHIIVSVIDDGEGSPQFAWSMLPRATGGFGLFSIQSRLVDFGAYAEIDGRHGFTVKIVLPDGLLLAPH